MKMIIKDVHLAQIANTLQSLCKRFLVAYVGKTEATVDSFTMFLLIYQPQTTNNRTQADIYSTCVEALQDHFNYIFQ